MSEIPAATLDRLAQAAHEAEMARLRVEGWAPHIWADARSAGRGDGEWEHYCTACKAMSLSGKGPDTAPYRHSSRLHHKNMLPWADLTPSQQSPYITQARAVAERLWPVIEAAHVVLCQAVTLLNQCDTVGAGDVLRKALVDDALRAALGEV